LINQLLINNAKIELFSYTTLFFSRKYKNKGDKFMSPSYFLSTAIIHSPLTSVFVFPVFFFTGDSSGNYQTYND